VGWGASCVGGACGVGDRGVEGVVGVVGWEEASLAGAGFEHPAVSGLLLVVGFAEAA
jgi:hypothetical protein